MKKLIVIFTMLIIFSCNTKEKKAIYLYCDINSEETFSYNYDRNNISRKIYLKKGDSTFYIYQERFKSINQKKIDNSEYEKIEFSTVETLKNAWKKSKLFSKRKVFDEIFIITPNENYQSFHKYKVKWVDYNY